MQGFVYCPAYIGRERRTRPNKRFFERRRVDSDTLAPSVDVALRQLSMHVIDLADEGAAPDFENRLGATRALAAARGRRLVADKLSALGAALVSTAPARRRDLADIYVRQAMYVSGCA